MLSNEQVGERVSRLTFEYYEKLKDSGKPTTRSNGAKEWTVLSSVVAIDESAESIRLISLATGVKATPNLELGRSDGKILHDCHAEILAVRGFNTVLMRQAIMLQDGRHSEADCDLIEKSTEGLAVKGSWSFALYVSRAPCGDASMDLLKSDDSASFTEDDHCQYADPNVKTVLRGRFNYKKRGFVRTKPGRKDSSVTLSKSCTDKLCCRQFLSLFNALNWDLFLQPVFLKYLVVPQVTEALKSGFNRAFNQRISTVPIAHHLKLISCEKSFSRDKTDDSQVPAFLGAVLLHISPALALEQQCIVNGVKNGSYVKAPKPLRKRCETVVSRASQWSLYKRLKQVDDHVTYCDFKNRQLGRNALKLKIRLALSSDGWVPTKHDDCI
ncbi:LADA_0G16204g1_1 [Lachancea dasiensis]|uniref:LADA_0G16204g1_1 n=1 Tax=Lachancea dasiensis TaxID=1072105 RepID=A0A1G4JX45_9SACH|nr:LADA_0G16204g1_1 [Lachancea dasiensis]